MLNALLVSWDVHECQIANALTDAGLVPGCRILVSNPARGIRVALDVSTSQSGVYRDLSGVPLTTPRLVG